MKKLKDISILFIINLMILLFVSLSSAEDTNIMSYSEESINSSEEGENLIEGKNTSDNKRFVDNGDGTVTDLKTNLMWLNKPKFFMIVTFDDAVDYCKNLSYNNLTGWRLPTAWEFQSIIDGKQQDPALVSGHPFKNITVSYFYWTQTQSEFSKTKIYVVDLYYGKIGEQKNTGLYKVWPVRDIK